VLELWFDFSCPYAYLASKRAMALGWEIDWRPMLLGGVFRGIGAGDGPMATLSAQKAAHNATDMHRWAEVFDVPLHIPPAHPMRTVRALRVLLALPRERWPRAIAALYAAYWEHGHDLTRDDVIATSLAGAGIDAIGDALRRADDDDLKRELRRRTDDAIGHGVFGAPAWRVGEHLFWGQDRIAFVEAAVAGWNPEAGPPPGGPRPFATSTQPRANATLDVYFDVASPFSYLALTQLRGLGAAPRLVPILLGGLFREIGTPDVPLLQFPPAKMRHIELDMARWARWWGVPFDRPTKFPQRTVTAQRVCLLAADAGWEIGLAAAIALARAMWAEQRDLESPDVLRDVLAAAKLPTAWVDQASEPRVKAALVANTTAAKDARVFGVPTFVVDGAQLFWGQDRLELVARALA
jgi:2-hydroxychromene-2-carboxylate isomerase